MFEKKITINSNKNYILIFLLFLSVLAFSSINPYLQASESWIYWFLNKELKNGLPFFGRSPIYVIYLDLFKFFKGMNAVKIEWIFTTFICITSIFYFINIKLNNIISFLICIVLIPYIWTNEPRSQILGATLAFWALTIFVNKSKLSLFHLVFIFILILIASFARPNYYLFLFGIFFYLIFNQFKISQTKENYSFNIFIFLFLIIISVVNILLE